MGMNTKIVLVTFILWNIQCSCTSGKNIAADVYSNESTQLTQEPPSIIPSEPDITVNVGLNVSIECESSEPIHWTFFEGFAGDYRIRDIHTSNIRRPYGSVLELIMVNHTYVGEYYCVNNEPGIEDKSMDDLKDELKASTIYLFVNDSENLLADVLNPMVQGVQYSYVIIPCKPTSKQIEVQLIKDDVESHHFDSTYDPTIGFTIRLMAISDGGSYVCRAKDDPKDIEYYIHVNILTDTEYLNKPVIQSHTGRYATIGEELTLNCSVEIQFGVVFKFQWYLPNNNRAVIENRVIFSNDSKVPHDKLQIGQSSITVLNLDKHKDEGVYRCEVQDMTHREHDEITISILKANEGSVFVEEPSNRYKIEISSSQQEAKWRVIYGGHPIPKLIWYDNRHREIQITNPDKYEVQIGDDYTILKIRSLQLSDTGNYTLKAYNGIDEKEKVFQLIVKDKPSVFVKNVYEMVGNPISLVCECAGYPASEITWSFTPCNIRPSWPTCGMSRLPSDIMNIDPMSDTINVTSLAQKSEISFTPNQPGIARCMAKNSEGNDTAEAEVLIGDLQEPLFVWIEAENNPIAATDAVTLHCGALVYNYTAELNWYLNDEPLDDVEGIVLNESNTDYSYRKTLSWKNIQTTDTGTYECRANLINGETQESKSIDLEIKEPFEPKIQITNIDKDLMKKNLGEPLRLECKFTGIPIPQIIWYKDGVAMKADDNDTRIGIHDGASILDIKFIKMEDEGQYLCKASNRVGSSNLSTSIKIQMPPINKAWIVAIAVLILVLVISTIYLCIRVRRGKRLLKEMKAAGLMNFVEGNPDSINPELALDEQADLLPYDKKYEFPREKLKLGKQLGAGAFGVVVKATAQGILTYEDETTVAVKMVKHTADNEVMRALVTELKIMVHLGQHLNVVNLLGAVTKNIAKREVMVIVEYCRFGNVQNFLVKHREYFVDQINPETDIIDPTILTKEQRWSNDSGYEYNSNKKGGGKPNNDKGYIRHSGLGEYFPGGMDSASTEAALITTSAGGGEDNLVLSNNSVQPAWRSNYKMDYKGPLRYITTTDLVCWSFQIARGMDYLSSRKVLHGDLAARNILLCDNNIVKICDFGLARSMYKSDNYKKKGEAPLPFKWLAIESIGDQVFSTYSDVWSFGIVMWELFSLGKVPYPGMDADQQLYFKIKDGYRMEKPETATQEIYDIMLNCWKTSPETRPQFAVLEKRLGKMLENNVAEHYIDLNEPYLQSNIDMLNKGDKDYLSLVGPPEGHAPGVPNYINKNVFPNSNVPDYLRMSPKSGSVIFSPRPTDTVAETEFNYPPATVAPTIPTSNNILNTKAGVTTTSPKNKSSSTIPEEVPMLKTTKSNDRIENSLSDNDDDDNGNDNDDEKNSHRKWAERQFSDFRPEPAVRTTVQKPSAPDHYVNVPAQRFKRGDDAVSNPGYIAFAKIDETKT